MNVQEIEARFKEIDEAKFDVLDVTLTKSSPKSYQLNVKGRPMEIFGPPRKPGITLLDLNVSEEDVTDDYIVEKIQYASQRDKIGDLPGVKVSLIGATGWYEVVEDYSYRTTYSDFGFQVSGSIFFDNRENTLEHELIAKKGFVYDRASIPRIFWVIISKDDLSNVPPLFHDLLYTNGGVLPNDQVTPYRTFTREEADTLFHTLMGRCGVSRWRSDLAYLAVKEFSEFAWKSKIF